MVGPFSRASMRLAQLTEATDVWPSPGGDPRVAEIRLGAAPPAAFPVTVDLRDDKAAWKEAVEYAGEVLRDIDGELPSNTDWVTSVKNDGARRSLPSVFKRTVMCHSAEAASARRSRCSSPTSNASCASTDFDYEDRMERVTSSTSQPPLRTSGSSPSSFRCQHRKQREPLAPAIAGLQPGQPRLKRRLLQQYPP